MPSANRPPLPPFSFASAAQKVRMAEDAWNSRDPARVALAYSENSVWRNRTEFFEGRAAIIVFLQRKWVKEIDYRLIKELWAFHDNRMMRRREASINDVPITSGQRKFFWPAGPRPADHAGLTELGM